MRRIRIATLGRHGGEREKKLGSCVGGVLEGITEVVGRVLSGGRALSAARHSHRGLPASDVKEKGRQLLDCDWHSRMCVCVESNLVAGWPSWTKFSDGGRQPLMIWKIVRPAVAVAQRSIDRNPTFTPNLAVRSNINWPVRAFLQNWG